MIQAMLKSRLKKTPAYYLFRRLQARWDLLRWHQARRKEPSAGPPAFATPPRLFKQQLVAHYATIFASTHFLETGTFLGDMLYEQRKRFRYLTSIEIDPDLHQRAQRRFSRQPHIEVHCGDSGSLLSQLLPKRQEPCLFWLDAHAMSPAQRQEHPIPPILRELEAILAQDRENCVLLIDDARLFVPGSTFPTLKEVEDLISRHRPDWVFETKDDVIRAHRKLAKE